MSDRINREYVRTKFKFTDLLRYLNYIYHCIFTWHSSLIKNGSLYDETLQFKTLLMLPFLCSIRFVILPIKVSFFTFKVFLFLFFSPFNTVIFEIDFILVNYVLVTWCSLRIYSKIMILYSLFIIFLIYIVKLFFVLIFFQIRALFILSNIVKFCTIKLTIIVCFILLYFLLCFLILFFQIFSLFSFIMVSQPI